jgi:phytoene desaturase
LCIILTVYKEETVVDKKIVVIGAGIGGLAASALLAKKGFDVTVVEKNNQIGGRARIWETEGFRFDMGPSWYLMPEVFENFFELFGRERKEFYELEKLDPAYTAYFNPQESVRVRSEPEAVKALFDRFEPGGGAKLESYLAQAAYKYQVAVGEFLYRDYTSIFDFLNRKLIIEGTKLNVFKSLDKVVGKYFSNRRSRQLLEYAMVFLGTSPKDAPALYSIMSHMDLNQGVFYPRGGLAAVPRSIGELAESLGAQIVTGTPVKKIEVDDQGSVQGVRTSEGMIEADLVVVNADYSFAETELLDPFYRSFPAEYWKRKVWAPSMFVLYLGLNKKLTKLTHHNLYFAPQWHDHFDMIFKQPAWPEKPCFYVSCISKTDPDSAPAEGENVFVLVPVAPGLDDNNERRNSYADYIIEHIETITGESISDSVRVKHIYSQRDFIADYNAYRGTALGLAHTLRQTAFFRPPFRSKRVQNLYYTGQYTHPGVGVPMVLIASQVMADIVKGEAA